MEVELGGVVGYTGAGRIPKEVLGLREGNADGSAVACGMPSVAVDRFASEGGVMPNR